MTKRKVFFLFRQQTDSSWGCAIPGNYGTKEEAQIAKSSVDCATNQEIIVDSRYILVHKARKRN